MPIVYRHTLERRGRPIEIIAEIEQELDGTPHVVRATYDDLRRTDLEGDVILSEQEHEAVIDCWYQTEWRG